MSTEPKRSQGNIDLRCHIKIHEGRGKNCTTDFTDDSTAKSNFTTENTENTEIRRRRIAEHFLLNSLLSLFLTSVISVSSVVAFLLFAVESTVNHFPLLSRQDTRMFGTRMFDTRPV